MTTAFACVERRQTMKDEIILAIESSCDETAIAILKNGKEILVNTVNTQISEHQKFGGVYPELASRLHLENISKVVAFSLSLKGFDYKSITHVAVTIGPGLPGALQIGVMAAKTLASYLDVPLIPVHHLAGHIYANEFVKDFTYPLISLVASGGNSDIVYIDKCLHFKVIGQTLDDAIGESLDKVARCLDLPYPGGVSIDKLTKDKEDIKLINLPKVSLPSYNLSYSGLKSHIVRMIEEDKRKGLLDKQRVLEYAKSTEVCFVDQLLNQLYKAYLDYKPKMVVVGGGVSANSYLRKRVFEIFTDKEVDVLIPPLWCTTDNALMIAKVASHLLELNKEAIDDISSYPNLSLEDDSIYK